MAADCFVVPTATGRRLFVLVLRAHDRRRVVHVGVTAHPTAPWTAQQLREAVPWDTAPRFLRPDHDQAFDRVTALRIHEIRTVPHAPWPSADVERFIGSVRRACLDPVIICPAAELRRVLQTDVEYDTASRPHLALDTDAPVPRPVQLVAHELPFAYEQFGDLAGVC